MKYCLGVFGILIAVYLVVSWYWFVNKTAFWGNWNRVKSPLIIFDFDGTICPSYPLFIEQVNLLADEYNLRKIRADEYEKFRNIAPKNIMKTLGVSPLQLPFLLKKARYNVQKQLLELRPVPSIIEVLQKLKQQGYSLGMLTSNSLENVLPYLQKYKIEVFDFIYAGNNVFGKDKHLKRILRKTHLNLEKDQVIYIGDEIRDIEAARKAHFTSIGVTWGYNSLILLKESCPDFLLETPSEISSLLQEGKAFRQK